MFEILEHKAMYVLYIPLYTIIHTLKDNHPISFLFLTNQEMVRSELSTCALFNLKP